jgi:predicted small lipoprotein YifL
MKRALMIAMLLATVALVSGCGRKALPEYPPDADYPHRQYPAY